MEKELLIIWICKYFGVQNRWFENNKHRTIIDVTNGNIVRFAISIIKLSGKKMSLFIRHEETLEMFVKSMVS